MVSAAEDDRRGRMDWVHAIRTHYMSDDGVGWGSRAWDSTTAQVSVVSRRKMGKAAVPATADANGEPSSPTKKPPTPKSRRRVSPGSAGSAKQKGAATAYKGDYVEWVYGSVSSVLADCTAQLIDGRPAALDTVKKNEFCGIADKCCGAGRSAYAVAVAYIPSDVAAQVCRLDRNTPQGEAAYHDRTNHLQFIKHARPIPATDAEGGGAAASSPYSLPAAPMAPEYGGSSNNSGGGGGDEWACSSCTLVNASSDARCIACRSFRSDHSADAGGRNDAAVAGDSHLDHCGDEHSLSYANVSGYLGGEGGGNGDGENGGYCGEQEWQPVFNKNGTVVFGVGDGAEAGDVVARRQLMLVAIVFVHEPPAVGMRNAVVACREQGIRFVVMRDQAPWDLESLCRSSGAFTKPQTELLGDKEACYDEHGTYVDAVLLMDLPLRPAAGLNSPANSVVVDLGAPSLYNEDADVRAIVAHVLQSGASEVCFAQCGPHYRATIVSALQESNEQVVVIGTTEADLGALQEAEVAVTDPITAFLTMPGSPKSISVARIKSVVIGAVVTGGDTVSGLGVGRGSGGNDDEQSDTEEEEETEEVGDFEEQVTKKLRFVIVQDVVSKFLHSIATFYEPAGAAEQRQIQLRAKQAKYRDGYAVHGGSPDAAGGHGSTGYESPLRSPTSLLRSSRGVASSLRSRRGGGRSLKVKTKDDSKAQFEAARNEMVASSSPAVFTLDLDELRRYYPFASSQVINELRYNENISEALIDQTTASTIAAMASKLIRKYTDKADDDVVATDGTAGFGGVVEALARRFKHVHAVEQSSERLEILVHNMEVLGVEDDVTTHCGDYPMIAGQWNQDVIFLDASRQSSITTPSSKGAGGYIGPNDAGPTARKSGFSSGGGVAAAQSSPTRRRSASARGRYSPQSPGGWRRQQGGGGGTPVGGGRRGSRSTPRGGGNSPIGVSVFVYGRPVTDVCNQLAEKCRKTSVVILRLPARTNVDAVGTALKQSLPRCIVAPPANSRGICLIGILPNGSRRTRPQAYG